MAKIVTPLMCGMKKSLCPDADKAFEDARDRIIAAEMPKNSWGMH